MNARPRVLLFTGDGKGKTTAALGMAFRAAGHGMRTKVIQFVKNDSSVGEVAAAARSDAIEVAQTGQGFLPPEGDPRMDAHRNAAHQGLRLASETIADRRFSLVILDEICLAVDRGLLEEGQVEALVTQAAAGQCLVLTGRHATPRLVALADTVTEMRCVKHGLKEGISAQEGVER